MPPLPPTAPPLRLNARWLGLLAVTIVALYLCWLIVAPFLDVILWAVVLAIIAYPYHLRLRRRGIGRNLAAVISTLGVILVVLVPVALIFTAMAAQIPSLDQVQGWVGQAQHVISPQGWIYQKVDPYYDLDWLHDKAEVKTRISAFLQPLSQQMLGFVAGLAGSVIDICFALFTLFYLLRDNHKIGQAVMNFVPLEERESREVFDRCQDIIQASVQGVILIAALQGALGAIAFWALGLPSWILWGVVMFILSLIPALGSFVVWVPAAIYLAVTGHWAKAAILTAWGGIVINAVDNFLRPRLVGQKTGMHDLVIFFSVLGGLKVFGVLGLFVGPVVVALALSIVEVFKQVSAGWRTPPSTIITPEQVDIAPPPPNASATIVQPLSHPMEIDTHEA